MPHDPSDLRTLDRRYHDLVRLAYLVLPGRGNRVYRLAMARRIVDQCIPRRAGRRRPQLDARVRARVLDRAMRPSRLLRVGIGPWLRALPSRMPDRALTERHAGLRPAVRAAYMLRYVEAMPRYAVRDQLAAAGVADPVAALTEAETLPEPAGPVGDLLIGRPVRRRSRMPLAAATTLTAAVVAALVAAETGGSPQPVSAGRLSVTTAADDAWTTGKRVFDVWPARGDLAHEPGFIGRALAAWGRKGKVPAQPQLLYAGRASGVPTALLRDGRKIARYTEARGSRGEVQVLPAGPNASSPLALGGGRFLLAPWTVQAAALTPRRTVLRVQDGVTDPVSPVSPASSASPASASSGGALRGRCRRGPVLELRQPDRLMTVVDLGGLAPAEVIHRTSPGIRLWDRLACAVPRQANAITSATVWEFWSGSLPDGGGTGRWVCSRYSYLNGRTEGVSTLVDGRGVVRSTGGCGGVGAQAAVAGTWWRSPRGRWFYLAASSPGRTPRVTGPIKVRSSAPRYVVAESRKQGRPPAVPVVLSAGPVR